MRMISRILRPTAEGYDRMTLIVFVLSIKNTERIVCKSLLQSVSLVLKLESSLSSL
jgi:hypothetical protein